MRHLFLATIFLFTIAPNAHANNTECKPLIGVSGQSETSRTVVPLLILLNDLGATTIYLGPQKNRDAAQDIPTLDGLVLGGNSNDIHPSRYGQPLDERTNEETTPYRGDYEYAAIEIALNKDIPLLGICGGAQRITVSGTPSERGSLKQHVDDQNQGKYSVPLPPFVPTDTISVEANSWLAGVMELDDGNMHVNSYHHQVPDTLRNGFVVSARSAKHGTIEAIEPAPDGPYAGKFAIGVMWHPEFSGDALSRALMKRFVREAHIRACGEATD